MGMTSKFLETNFKHYRDVYAQTQGRGVNIAKLAQQLYSKDKIQHGLKILNVGSGPNDSTKTFVETFLPFCQKMVLCEMNPLFCADYNNSTWLKNNNTKIDIYNCDIFDFNMKTKKYNYLNSFDLIWCNHVLYHIDFNQFSTLIFELNKLLLPNKGYMMISVSNDNFYGPKLIHRKLKPQYCLSKYLDQLMYQLEKEYVLKWFVVLSEDKMFMTKDHAANLLQLFVEQDVYSRKVFHPSGIISQNDKLMIKNAVNDAINEIWIDNCLMSVANHYFIKQFVQRKSKI